MKRNQAIGSRGMMLRAVRLLPLLALMAGCGRKEPVSLVFQPVPGQDYRFVQTTAMKAEVGLQGDARTMAQTVTYRFRLNFSGRDASGGWLGKVSWTGLAFSQTTAQGSYRYDSDHPGGDVPVPARPWNALVGESADIRVGPDGRVTAVPGAEPLAGRLLAKMGVAATPEAIGAVRRQFGEEALREGLDRLLGVLPAGPVVPGATWTRETTVAQGYPMKLSDAYTLTEAGPSQAVVEVKTAVKPNVAASALDLGGQKARFELSGESVGSVRLDRKDGLATAGTRTLKASGKMLVADAASGKNFEMPFNITDTYELKRER